MEEKAAVSNSAEVISMEICGSGHQEEELLKIINQDAMDDYVLQRIPSDHNMENMPSQRGDGYNSDSEGSEASEEEEAKPVNTFEEQHPIPTARPSRRMSMRMPSFSAFHVSTIDERENAAFLEQLTHIITDFPVPPSHEHTISTQTSINAAYNNISDLVGLSSKTAIKAVSDGWGAMAKFAGKLTTGGLVSRKSNVGDSESVSVPSTSGIVR